jgi:DNA-binding transcriptional LysR family regulator
MLSLNEIVIFITAAECSNFSEAGRKLHLSQPAVSQAIDNLEKRFGNKLFLRKGRSVQLTEIGQSLLPMAKELIAYSRRLEETMMSLEGKVVGEMTLGCSTASGKYLLPRLIAQFRQKYPLVKINVSVSSRKSVINRLISGDFPLGISSKKIEHSELEYQDFFTDDVILVVPPNHPWADYKRIFPDDLLDEPLILREPGAGTREILMESLHQNDILPDTLNVTMEIGNAEAIEMAVEEGIGVAFISRLAAARGIELGNIVEVEVPGMNLERRIYIARNRNYPGTRLQTEFWDFVKSQNIEIFSTPDFKDAALAG